MLLLSLNTVTGTTNFCVIESIVTCGLSEDVGSLADNPATAGLWYWLDFRLADLWIGNNASMRIIHKRRMY